jgi:hypothetical protein
MPRDLARVGRGVALAVGLAACGAKPKPQPPPPPAPAPHAAREPVEDSEPEEGVTIVSAHGHMEKDAIDAWLNPHQADLMDCYLKRVRGKRWLGGHVKLHWDINKDGTIAAVKLMAESDLGARPVEKCLLELAQAAEFDKPVGGDADFDIPLDFTPTGHVTPWDEDRATHAIGGQLAKLDTCGKKVEPPDDVVVTLYVGPRGRAQSVGFSSDASVIDDKWAECAERVALAWRLPDPKGTVGKLAIRYRPR